ncbi:hypothetical protein MAPG_03537 [Magnaporthiopsis poae ATCC 64411]|uniref:Uncharacterized protein n=1 Tax=Magnaporthiopsis poae (strain ATCC 64411 / 73-15) TaxID=644358 RepID=A0A0C4DUA0_MAGP6|nr:hypothetical protein MAPG_03537 [Magnaporthiopsis poae ATCC 64411]
MSFQWFAFGMANSVKTAPGGRRQEWWRDPDGQSDGPQPSQHLVPNGPRDNGGPSGAGKRHGHSASAAPVNNVRRHSSGAVPRSWRRGDHDDYYSDSEVDSGRVFSMQENARFQAECDPNQPTDVTITLELPITANIDRELNALERLRRLGDMKAAREFFHRNLEVYMPNDLYIFVKYAEILLDMGDYKAVVALTNHKDCEPAAAPTTDADSPEYSPRLLLGWRWRLIRGLAKSFTDERSSADHEALEALDYFRFGPVLGHLELQVAVLIFRILQSRSQRLRLFWRPADPSWSKLQRWVKWDGIMQGLADEGREWDLCDFVAATDSLLEYIGWLGSARIQAFDPASLSSCPQSSEAAVLASLHLLVESCLHELLTLDSVRSASEKNRPLAASLARRIMEHHPQAMRSRAYLRWLLYEAAAEGCEANTEARRVPSASPIHPAYWNHPGRILLRGSEWIALPVYSPVGTEVPAWEPLPIPPAGNGAVLLALEIAKEMDDIPTQILAYKLLALRDPNPSLMLWAIVDLQSKQGDWYDQLETLACRYIGCNDRDSRRRLLDQLMALQERVGTTADIDYELLHAVNAIVSSLRTALGIRDHPTPWDPA